MEGEHVATYSSSGAAGNPWQLSYSIDLATLQQLPIRAE